MVLMVPILVPIPPFPTNQRKVLRHAAFESAAALADFRLAGDTEAGCLACFA